MPSDYMVNSDFPDGNFVNTIVIKVSRCRCEILFKYTVHSLKSNMNMKIIFFPLSYIQTKQSKNKRMKDKTEGEIYLTIGQRIAGRAI